MVQQLPIYIQGIVFNPLAMYPCKLLIIDDDKEDLELLSDALIESGSDSFHCVQSAEEAILFLEECTNEDALPRLIVTDLYLPATNGIQLIKTLKQTDRYSRIPIYVLSTLKFELVKELHQNLAATDYIKKPTCYQDYLKMAAFLSHECAA